MFLTVDDVRAAIAVPAADLRSDFDLNPDVRAVELGVHKQRRAAVLCGLRPVDGHLHVVLTHRAQHLKQHAGQVAFPGGKIDAEDRDATDAALREAEEEVGLPRTDVEVIGTLDDYLTSTGYRVTPVIGLVPGGWQPLPDPNEVDRVFEPPLSFLMNPANHERHHREWQGRRRYFYAMPWEGHYIWGATAGMLKHLSDRIAATRAGAA